MVPPDQDGYGAPAPLLREPAHLVSRRARTYWTVRAAGGWLVLLVGQVAWFWQDDSHRGLRILALAVTVLAACRPSRRHAALALPGAPLGGQPAWRSTPRPAG